MVENYPYLFRTMCAGAMRVQVDRHGAKRPTRMLDIRDQSAKPAKPLLFAPHLVLAVRDRHSMNVTHWPGPHLRAAVDRARVLPRHLRLDAGREHGLDPRRRDDVALANA